MWSLEDRGLRKNQRVVITDGAGFIGSNLVRVLCEVNEGTVIDNLLTGRHENISEMADRVRFVIKQLEGAMTVIGSETLNAPGV